MLRQANVTPPPCPLLSIHGRLQHGSRHRLKKGWYSTVTKNAANELQLGMILGAWARDDIGSLVALNFSNATHECAGFLGPAVHVETSYSKSLESAKVAGCCRRMKYGKTPMMYRLIYQTRKYPPHTGMSKLTGLQTKLSEQKAITNFLA
jgi:hypothetical protein